MSRFSKAEAEARGWAFVHEREQFDVGTSDVQGETRTTPAEVRAEKTINGQNVSVTGESTGQTLERIHALETHLDSLPQTGPAALDVSGLPRDEAGFPLRTVRTPEGDFTDAEWAARSRNDIIVTEEGQQFLSGATEDAQPLAALDKAADSVSAVAREDEVMRSTDFRDRVGTKQIETSTADAIDAPGIGAGGVVRIPAEDESVAETAAKQTQRAHDEEAIRVNESDAVFGRRPTPEGMERMAGMDVGLASRGDLGSEIPPVGHTVAFVEGELARGDTEPEAATIEGPTAEAVEEQATARDEAVETKAKEVRDDEGTAAADKPENVQAARTEGIDAAAATAEQQSDDMQREAEEERTDESGEASHDVGESSTGDERANVEPQQAVGAPGIDNGHEDAPASPAHPTHPTHESK